jgi:bifunctional DNA-binding transcriptional regulator/antitoxin component of YhaV-PrlF toxin-antitoxin module
MTTVLGVKGQIVMPADLRNIDNLKPGDDFSVVRVGPGRYLYEKIVRAKARATIRRAKGQLPVVISPQSSTLTSVAVKELADGILA